MTKNNTLNYFFVLYAFCVPISKAGITLFCILILLTSFFMKDFKQKFLESFNNKVIVALFIFIVYNFISLLNVQDENISKAFDTVVKYWYYSPILIMAMYMKKEFVSKVLSAFFLGMLVSELMSYGMFFELVHTKYGTSSNPTPFMNHLNYSIFLAISSLLLLDKVVYEQDKKFKLFYFLFFISVTINLFIIGGRSGQLAFFLTLFILIFLRFENKIKAFIYSIAIFSTIFILAYSFSDIFNKRVNQSITNINKIINEQNYCTSWGMRTGALIIGKDIVLDNPLFGVGIKDNIDELKNRINNQYPHMKCFSWFEHFHNQYMEILTELGIVGLMLFLYIFYCILKLKIKNEEIRLLKYIVCFVFLIGFIAEPFLIKHFMIALFTLMVGITVSQERIENKERRKI